MLTLREPYLRGSSLVHQLDPRLKLVGTCAYVLCLSTLPRGAWHGLAALAALVAVAVGLARLPWLTLLKRTALALPFVGLIALSTPFVGGGQPIWAFEWGPVALSVTREGLLSMATILAKAWLAIWMGVLLTATTPLPSLLQGLWLLRLPPILCTTLTLMIRYLFVLADEAARLQTARAARSAGKGRTVFWRALVLGHMIGSLLIRSLGRAERIYAAMLARGYEGTPRAMHRIAWRASDTRVALGWGVALLGAVGLAWL